jgi:AcrR family transcriptional regulator
VDGRARRTQRIIERVKAAALELFSAHNAANVTMDEVAARAGVSKVTIYKHFHSKDELQRAAIDLYVDQVLAASEALLTSDLDFLEKLRRVLVAQVERPALVSNNYLFELLEKDRRAGGRLDAQLKRLIYSFFEEGKRAGYVEHDLPFEVLYLHSQIYQAGFKARLRDVEATLVDPQTTARLLDLFFYGVIKRPPAPG